MTTTQSAYAVLFLGAIAAVIHSVMVDPSAAGLFSPTVKAILGLIGIGISSMLPKLMGKDGAA